MNLRITPREQVEVSYGSALWGGGPQRVGSGVGLGLTVGTAKVPLLHCPVSAPSHRLMPC